MWASSRRASVASNSAGVRHLRLSSLLSNPLALYIRAESGEVAELSVSNFSENIEEASPDPYENNTSLVPANSSDVFLCNNSTV